MSTGRILVVDVGTSSVRAGIVRDDASVSDVVQIPIQASSPEPGQVEFDARAIQAAFDEWDARFCSETVMAATS